MDIEVPHRGAALLRLPTADSTRAMTHSLWCAGWVPHLVPAGRPRLHPALQVGRGWGSCSGRPACLHPDGGKMSPARDACRQMLSQAPTLARAYVACREKDASTTQASLGFKICGMQARLVRLLLLPSPPARLPLARLLPCCRRHRTLLLRPAPMPPSTFTVLPAAATPGCRCTARARAAIGARPSAGARRCPQSWWTRRCRALRTTVSGPAGEALLLRAGRTQGVTCWMPTARVVLARLCACALTALATGCPPARRARPAPCGGVRRRGGRDCAAGGAGGLVCGAERLLLLLVLW